MTPLTPGPELDLAVAKACGIELGGHVDAPPRKVVRNAIGVWLQDFCPSSDLNAAFEAAEKVGLFKFVPHAQNPLIFRGSIVNPAAWYIARSEFIDDVIGQGETLPMAICAAILHLHPPKEEE